MGEHERGAALPAERRDHCSEPEPGPEPEPRSGSCSIGGSERRSKRARDSWWVVYREKLEDTGHGGVADAPAPASRAAGNGVNVRAQPAGGHGRCCAARAAVRLVALEPPRARAPESVNRTHKRLPELAGTRASHQLESGMRQPSRKS